jgi:pyroglutamyl-peptidase
MLKVLLTGFEPFGGDRLNPSQLAVEELMAATPPEGIIVTTALLPVRYANIGAALRAAVEQAAPDVVIGTGLATGRTALSVERVAINLDDAPLSDNAGESRRDSAVVPGGPAAYFATVPVKVMVAAMWRAGVPATVSHSAGTFLCNHVFYLACHLAESGRPPMRAGFIHVPALPEMAASHTPAPPTLALPLMVRGLRAALGALAADAPHVDFAGGSVD